MMDNITYLTLHIRCSRKRTTIHLHAWHWNSFHTASDTSKQHTRHWGCFRIPITTQQTLSVFILHQTGFVFVFLMHTFIQDRNSFHIASDWTIIHLHMRDYYKFPFSIRWTESPYIFMSDAEIVFSSLGLFFTPPPPLPCSFLSFQATYLYFPSFSFSSFSPEGRCLAPPSIPSFSAAWFQLAVWKYSPVNTDAHKI